MACKTINFTLIPAVLQRKLEATQEELMRTQMRYQKEIEKLEKINKELKKQGQDSKPFHLLLATSCYDWGELENLFFRGIADLEIYRETGLFQLCVAPAEREQRSREEEDQKVPDRHVLRRPGRAVRLRLLLQHC